MTTGEQGENGNGRVTLALLGQKLDTVLSRLERIEQGQCKTDDRLNEVEKQQAVQAEQIKQARGVGAVVSGIAATVAAVIGVFVKP